MFNLINETPGQPVTLAVIEERAMLLADVSGKLDDALTALNTELDEVQRRHLKGVKKLAQLVAARETELRNTVESAPELFVKPRTYVFHGIKLGYSRSTGGVGFDDADQVVKLIRKHFPDDVDALIRTKDEPDKTAIGKLTAPEMAKIACRIEGEGDFVVLNAATGDIEKFVSKLIRKKVEAALDAPQPS